MKKKFFDGKPKAFLKTSKFLSSLLPTILIAVFGLALPGLASTEVDRQFQLETIGFLKSWDNMDGVFAEYVDAAYNNYFSQQSRFVINDLTQASHLLSNSKLSYRNVIGDKDILSQLARTTRTQSIIRTIVVKEGASYIFRIDWLHAPRMEEMASVRFTLSEPKEGSGFDSAYINRNLGKYLDQLISNVPFIAHVTGRDHEAVTINIGAGANLIKGDILDIGTLDRVKIHPLLNKIVDWQVIPTGRIEVDQVQGAMTFAKILDQEPGREIQQYQKVTHVETVQKKDTPAVIHDEIPPEEDLPPKLGWVSASALLGSYNRQFNTTAGATQNSGGGFAFGGVIEGEAWLNRSWFVNAEIAYAGWNLNQTNETTGAQTLATVNGGVGGSMFRYKIDVGYSYSFDRNFYGPRGWLKLGFKSDAYGLPSSLSELTGPITFNSIFVGAGGDLPLFKKWGLVGNFNLRLISFVNQNWYGDSISSSSDAEFYIAGYYRFKNNLAVRAGIMIWATYANFSTGSNLTQNTFSFTPSLVYSF